MDIKKYMDIRHNERQRKKKIKHCPPTKKKSEETALEPNMAKMLKL